MTDNGSNYWDNRYLRKETGWDLGRVSPPLQAYFDQLGNKDLAILIPGCGNSYEAEYLLQKGFTDVTLLDISPILIQRLREKFQQTEKPAENQQTEKQPTPKKPTPHLVTADFFGHNGAYDLMIEQTFFCALDPVLRPAYVEKTYELLRPRGRLAGLLFDRDFPSGAGSAEAGNAASGPPYGGHKEEYQKLLEKKFRLRTLTPCYNSLKPRAGTELFLIAEKII